VRRVSAALGLPRTRLYRLLAKWQIDLRNYRRRTSADRTPGADEL
jgi:hypothetical protein